LTILRHITSLLGWLIVCRSGDEQLAAATGAHQLADVKVADSSAHLSTGVHLPTGASSTHDAANQDLAKQLQSAVRSEMRRIMEV